VAQHRSRAGSHAFAFAIGVPAAIASTSTRRHARWRFIASFLPLAFVTLTPIWLK
jgi:hypothetical protein